MKKHINGQDIQMTAQEEAEWNISLEKYQTNIQKINDELVKKEADKANGNQKLLDLGLTQAEATALTGYTPPSEE